MIGKVVIVLVLVVALIGSIYLLYQNLPGEEEMFNVSLITLPEPVGEEAGLVENRSYPKTPVFFDNLRFNHKQLSYSFHNCEKERKQGMLNAMSKISERTELLFYESGDAEIIIDCSGLDTSVYEAPFIVGEGGPTAIVDTGLYNVILEGKVLLHDVESCDNNVELHELLHVLGLNHSENPKNIMYYLSGCDKELTNDIIETLNKLYSIKPLPDLYFVNLSAVKKGRYLDFNAEIKNQGMIDVMNASLVLFSNEKKVESFELGKIEFGAGKILYAENIRLPSRGVIEISFIIDGDEKIEEVYENNNMARLSLG